MIETPHDNPGSTPTRRLVETSVSPEHINPADVAMELIGGSVLAKYYGPEQLDEAYRRCNLSSEQLELVRGNVTVGGGRALFHVIRLLKHGGVERDFGLAWTEYSAKNFGPGWRRAITDVIGSEGADTKMFWTMAPYILKTLVARGKSVQEAVQALGRWATTGISVKTELHKPYDTQGYWGEVHLLGLDRIVDEIPGGWELSSRNQNDVSHRLAAQEAAHVVDLLLKTDNPNKEPKLPQI